MNSVLKIVALLLLTIPSIYAENVVLEVKVVCATSPGEVIEFGGFNKIGPNGQVVPRGDTTKKGAFAVTGHKECYLFIQQIKNQTPQEINKAASAIAQAVDPAIVEIRK
jgi:hypothetical protein